MPNPTPQSIVEKLSEAQRRAILNAYSLSGPSGDCYTTNDDDFAALYYDLDPPLVSHTGRLLRQTLQVRAILSRKEQNDG